MRQFLNYVERLFKTKVQTIRPNNAKELIKVKHTLICITYQSSCIETPQQNGIVKRKHKHLLETTRALYFPIYQIESQCIQLQINLHQIENLAHINNFKSITYYTSKTS